WYYTKTQLKPGQRWQFVVRLKPPSGFQNPGGFDYEAWLYQQNIHATGYIRKSSLNKKVNESYWLSMVDRLRFKIKETINSNTDAEMAALLNALAIGYRGDMSAETWQVFIKTGTNHLIAISGLHIGLIAGFVWMSLRLLARIKVLSPYFSHRSLLVYSFIAALIYAALAGFTIPTQRALIMLAVVYTGLFLYRQLTVMQSLSLALIVVLVISPTSVLSVGFWLSFLAVAAISYSMVGRFSGRNKLISWLWPQIVVIVALMPLSFYFFQQSSVIALLANIVAIPLIGMLILPVLLLALLIAPIHTGLSSLLLSLSADILSYLLMFLHYLSEVEFSVWVHSEADILSLLLAMTGLVLLFVPYAFPARILSVFLLMPLLAYKNQTLPENDFELHVLDVGQGLSVFIKTKNHHLLFDAGARFSDRFDVGEKVVVPFLRHQGVRKLDRIIISNGDNDHIGGAQVVIDNIETERVIGRDIEKLNHGNTSLCIQGQKWSWDGVDFEILHPLHQHYRKRNNYSCVLKVSNAVNSLLITGDIEKKVEKELLKEQPESLKVNVLIVPHHGSKTSSTVKFLRAVKPEIAIYSSGFLNRYRFPRPEVVERYTDMGVMQLNTAKSGHISLLVDQNRLKDRIISYRHQYRRYWHRTANKTKFR
ncbi:MAG: DNA internalization-related competence protein ComEC/Rec2, partial [Gammaproteobacteria bacterium]|nr:DNA internalization-related competence protein ComEC/Rec2 [Gammaproteobacteria bacterium]